ncbi:forkhead domain-containing protein 4 [Elsinoe australis]|uniref:Forkhead domain-containing protein 4 n=1 Tax=Elsinoe australis TaxID=40998 RepID=A0A4U7ANE3_9PEZI|nr:forkhead domain-containing protein 4 [Elsinoe australis]
MPPSSKRSRAARKAADLQEPSDAETPESIATPSRPTRKRGRAADNAPSSQGRAATRRKIKDTRQPERDDTEGTEGGDQSDADTEPAIPTEAEIISKLKVPDRLVYATQDFANDLLEGHENVPGYGKIAGRDWTYIIKELEVTIGRPEQHEKAEQAQELGGSQGGSETPSHKSKIAIDLGPDRQTSRLHATISYDSDRGQWFVVVSGRNGLRIDTNLVKRGQKAYLRSGSVVDICGTQMAFITTPTAENEGPVFADAIIRQTYTSDDTDPDGDAGGKYSHANGSNGANARRGALPPGFSDDQPSSTRVHPHSAAGSRGAAVFATPGTPIRQQAGFQPQYSKPSPASNGYSRGVMIESTESIDYSADSAKDLKPPHSYAQLIGMAIMSTSEQQMTLNNIYKYIMANYAFYRYNTGGWQNSIRHNLSLNKAFEKIARRTDEPGKGMKWMISPKERDNFLSQGMKGCRPRPNPLPSGIRDGSDPSSPVIFGGRLNPPSTVAKVEKTESPQTDRYARAYPTANEAYTPDRGSRRPINSMDDNDPELTYYPPSAKSTLNHLTAAANAAGSPPALYMNDENRLGLDTPFPIRSSQKLMPPSTLQRPSTFMEFSSPAPFWKFGSTPLKPLTDISPMKTPFSNFKPLSAGIKEGSEEKEDMKSSSDGKPGELFEASSPPQPNSATELGDGSPLRAASRSFSGKHEPSPILAKLDQNGLQNGRQSAQPSERSRSASQGQQQPQFPPPTGNQPVQQSIQQPPHQNGTHNGGMQHQAPQQHVRPQHAHAPNVSTMPRFENDDDDGIDLMKGFQPIGSFHKMGAARFGMGAVGR